MASSGYPIYTEFWYFLENIQNPLEPLSNWEIKQIVLQSLIGQTSH